MKKLIRFTTLAIFLIALSTTSFAKDYSNLPEVFKPTKDGNDVIFSNTFIKTVPRAADDYVLVRFHDSGSFEQMTQEGKNWRAKNAVGEDVHPYIGNPNDYKPRTNFAKIERMSWSGDASVVTHRGQNICVNVK